MLSKAELQALQRLFTRPGGHTPAEFEQAVGACLMAGDFMTAGTIATRLGQIRPRPVPDDAVSAEAQGQQVIALAEPDAASRRRTASLRKGLDQDRRVVWAQLGVTEPLTLPAMDALLSRLATQAPKGTPTFVVLSEPLTLEMSPSYRIPYTAGDVGDQLRRIVSMYSELSGRQWTPGRVLRAIFTDWTPPLLRPIGVETLIENAAQFPRGRLLLSDQTRVRVTFMSPHPSKRAWLAAWSLWRGSGPRESRHTTRIARLEDIVAGLGGVPARGKMAFWETVAQTWTGRTGTAVSATAMRKAWERRPKARRRRAGARRV